MNRLVFWVLFGVSHTLLAQQQPDFNLTLLSNRNDFAQVQYSDIWGYVDSTGREYAVMGTRQGTAVYRLDDPTDPQLVEYVTGTRSIWRDIKDHGDYLYVIADQGTDGLLVINMSEAPDTVTHQFYKPLLSINGLQRQLTDCHNVFIDENGYLYLSGCSISNGVMIFDLNADPVNPPYLGRTPTNYSHDVYVRGDTLWTSDFNDGVFSVVDVSNKRAPTLLATQPTAFQGTHNAWLSDDGDYLFTTDERPNAFVEAYDVSDLDNIELADQYRPIATEGRGVFPHNTHYYQQYLVTSYYTDGVKIIDAARPHNLIETGSYDTYSGPDGGTNGCWGAYPYLPSGLVLASDIQTGLYVLEPTYQRACYLEGSVRSTRDDLPIADVSITILSDNPNQSTSDRNGEFATGQSTPGTFRVAFERIGYLPDTATVSLNNGEVTELDIALRPAVRYQVAFSARDTDGAAIPNTQIYLAGEDIAYTLTTNNNGLAATGDILEGTYQVFVGAWGYLEQTIETFSVLQDRQQMLTLERGYQDNFNLDLGWKSFGVATTGYWERGRPVPTSFGDQSINPGSDVHTDTGNQCYVTGNGGQDAGFDDVDDGQVVLESPMLDLAEYHDPRLHLAYWFVNTGGNTPLNDTFAVYISNGQEEALLFAETSSDDRWRTLSGLPLSGTIDLAQPVFFRFTASDFPPDGHLVEAGIDAFSVTEGTTTSTRSPFNLNTNLNVWPNPASGPFQVEVFLTEKSVLHVFNALGQRQEMVRMDPGRQTITLGQGYAPGVYYLRLQHGDRFFPTRKIVMH